MTSRSGLSKPDIHLLVNDYIGTSADGYLGGFSYSIHEEFYPRFCDLDIDVPAARQRFGTTRKAFIGILEEAPPDDQVRIVEGTFRKFAERDAAGMAPAQENAKTRLTEALTRIRGGPAVEMVDLRGASRTVHEAIRDASTLLRERGSTSGLDRLHTSLYGFLRSLCDHANLAYGERDETTKLWSILRKGARELAVAHPEREQVEKVLNGLATIIGALEALRNRASLAHPNEDLLSTEEAALAIDAIHTVANYLTRKFNIAPS